jgi:hypothetical protein
LNLRDSLHIRLGRWRHGTDGLVGPMSSEMLGIRCAIYNGTYNKVFEKYKKFQIPL